ncbi:MAG: hypothetical protein ACE15B_00995 [Bryobacteraceae bacterium]
MEDECGAEWTLGRFNRLMDDLLRGGANRNCFEPWEIDLLLDIAGCEIPPQRRRPLLKAYQRAAARRMDYGEPPLKLSEFLRESGQLAGLQRETPR